MYSIDAEVINSDVVEHVVTSYWADADFEPSADELAASAAFLGEFDIDEVAPEAECSWPQDCACSECGYAAWADAAAEGDFDDERDAYLMEYNAPRFA